MKNTLRYISFVLILCLTLAVLLGCDEEIIQVSNPVMQTSTATVTFPEGSNVRRFAQRLEEKNVCSAEDFINACADYDWSAEYDFLPSYDVLSKRPYPLEGYLFPDTYEFFVGEDPHSCVRRFLNNFSRRVTDEMRLDCAAVGLTLDEAVTLASIIEKETNSSSEAPKVSMVFHNRMNNPTGYKGIDETYTGGYFQSDATKYYPYVYGEELPEGFVSEYNTYNFAGLPKGSICNPGLACIKAAIYPDTECNALFFYTDINSKHYYAVSYDEHLKNIQYCKDNGLS